MQTHGLPTEIQTRFVSRDATNPSRSRSDYDRLTSDEVTVDGDLRPPVPLKPLVRGGSRSSLLYMRSPYRRPRRSGTRASTSPQPTSWASLIRPGTRCSWSWLGPGRSAPDAVRAVTTATHINLFSSAAMGATAPTPCGSWSSTTSSGTSRTTGTFRLVGAFAAVLVSATAFTVWNQSNVNEKVYTVSLLHHRTPVLAGCALAGERLGKGKDDNLLVLMVVHPGPVASGNHLMAFLAAPALVPVHPVRPIRQTLLNYRLYVAGIAAVVVGLSIHLFLPDSRRASDPIINEAAPTCAPSVPFGPHQRSSPTATPDVRRTLFEALKRDAVRRSRPCVPRAGSPGLPNFVNFFQYFDWQWARRARPANRTSSFAHPLGSPSPPAVHRIGGPRAAVEHFKRDKCQLGSTSISLFAVLSVGVGLLHELQVRLLDAGSCCGTIETCTK